MALAEITDVKEALGAGNFSGTDALVRLSLEAAEEVIVKWVQPRGFEATPEGTVREFEVEGNLGWSSRRQPRVDIGPIISASLVETGTPGDEYREVDASLWNLRPFGEMPYRWLQLEEVAWQPSIVTRFLTDYDVYGRSEGTSIERVRVTGRFGYPEIPSRVKRAAILLGARFLQRNPSPLGMKGEGVSATYVRNNDPDLARMLDDMSQEFT